MQVLFGAASHSKFKHFIQDSASSLGRRFLFVMFGLPALCLQENPGKTLGKLTSLVRKRWAEKDTPAQIGKERHISCNLHVTLCNQPCTWEPAVRSVRGPAPQKRHIITSWVHPHVHCAKDDVTPAMVRLR